MELGELLESCWLSDVQAWLYIAINREVVPISISELDSNVDGLGQKYLRQP